MTKYATFIIKKTLLLLRTTPAGNRTGKTRSKRIENFFIALTIPPTSVGYFVDIELLADGEDVVDRPVNDQSRRK